MCIRGGKRRTMKKIRAERMKGHQNERNKQKQKGSKNMATKKIRTKIIKN